MASNFLDNLKNAVDNGEFNSEAAKRIKDIDKLANEKKDAEKLVEKRLEEAGVKTVTEEEVVAINAEYEKQMELAKTKDIAAAQLANLIEIEDMVKASISDMLSYVDELEDKFHNEFADENPLFGELSQKIEQIQSKYNSIINN